MLSEYSFSTSLYLSNNPVINYCQTLENKSSFAPNPPDEGFLFPVFGAGAGGALLQPPKSSSPAIVVCAGLVLEVLLEPQTLLAAAGGLLAAAAVAVLFSGVLHTSDEPQPSKPDPAFEKPADVTLGGC
jgi:hypothetical protein